MNEYLKKVFKHIGEFFGSLTVVRKAIVIGLIISLFAIIAGLFFWAGTTTFQSLMTNLNPEDSSAIMRVLRDKHIPYQVDPTGKNISVPPESLYELRLELATMGYPQTGVVGYELFDKQTLGTTSFVQKLNQRRAQEGELVRTITTIRGVKRARVHLAIPQKSPFVEDQKKATASVIIDLEAGTVLNEKQVYGIGNLVARAIEGMDVNDVVVVDSNGKVLSRNSSDPLAAATATQLDYQQKVESDIEKRVEAMLSRVVGDGHVVAKVTADIDFSQVNETQTSYDADGVAARSVERRADSNSGSRPGPYGVAGAAANTPGQPPAANSETKFDTNRKNEVTNYEIPQTIRKTSRASGQVKKLSVAVVVDGKHTKMTGKDGKVTDKVEAWSEEKRKEFEDVVATAVGLDRKRGDSLEIKSMEFQTEDFDEASKVMAEKDRKVYIQNMVMYGVIGLTIALFFFFVVRPFIKWVTENTIDSVDSFLPQTIEELERLQKNAALPGMEDAVPVLPEQMDPEKVEGEMIKEKIITLVDANPHKAALILRDWLHSDGKKKAAADAAAKEAAAKDKTG